MNSTVQYYDENAQKYYEATLGVNMSPIYEAFLSRIPKTGIILDAGSGSGRDTLFFLEKGYAVEAIDASALLAQLSTNLTNQVTRVMRFEEITEVEKYDGIWACASLLHVSRQHLLLSLKQLTLALKINGLMYFSFKYGTEDRLDTDGRHFTNMNEDLIRDLVGKYNQLKIERMWVSHGEGDQKGRGDWINTLVKKVSK